MPKSLALVGDSTTHGGTVISGASLANINGSPIARVGDKVSCPLFYPSQEPHGVNAIVDGAEHYLIDGIPAAVHGSKTECGCTLIASGPAVVS